MHVHFDNQTIYIISFPTIELQLYIQYRKKESP